MLRFSMQIYKNKMRVAKMLTEKIIFIFTLIVRLLYQTNDELSITIACLSFKSFQVGNRTKPVPRYSPLGVKNDAFRQKKPSLRLCSAKRKTPGQSSVGKNNSVTRRFYRVWINVQSPPDLPCAVRSSASGRYRLVTCNETAGYGLYNAVNLLIKTEFFTFLGRRKLVKSVPLFFFHNSHNNILSRFLSITVLIMFI